MVLNSICRFLITPLFLLFMPLKYVEDFVLCAVVCKMGSFVKINKSVSLGCNLVPVNALLTSPMRNIDTVCYVFWKTKYDAVRTLVAFILCASCKEIELVLFTEQEKVS